MIKLIYFDVVAVLKIAEKFTELVDLLLSNNYKNIKIYVNNSDLYREYFYYLQYIEKCENLSILKEESIDEIRKNNIKFTENKNGVFINMNKLSDKAIEDIELFLQYINNNYKKNLI